MAKIRAQLKELAFARSGDKGDVSNIGLMAKNRECYEVMKEQVTPERVKSHFRGMAKGDVKIYEMSNIDSLEVLLYRALGGGATRTLRLDQTGKSMGQALLRMEVEVEEKTLKNARAAEEAIYKKYRNADWGL